MGLVNSTRGKLAKRIFPFSILILAALVNEPAFLMGATLSVYVAGLLLVANAILILSVGFMPGRRGLVFRVCLSLASIASFVLLQLEEDAIGKWVLPANVAFIGVTWLVSLLAMFRFALRHFFQLRELHEMGTDSVRKPAYAPIAAHATDIHLTVTDDTARIEGGTGGHAQLGAWLENLSQVEAGYVLISGDCVDTGDPREWKRFIEQVTRYPWLKGRLVLAPGNHDLSDQYGDEDSGKLRRYFECQAQFAPTLTTSLGMTLSEVAGIARDDVRPAIATRRDEIKKLVRFDSQIPVLLIQAIGFRPHYYSRKAVLFAEQRGGSSLEYARSEWKFALDHYGVPRDFDFDSFALETLLDDWFVDRWHELFPLTLEDPDRGVVVIVLNSVPAVAQNVSESALGGGGKPQLSRLSAILNKLPTWTKTVLVMMHHAPYRRSGEFRLPLPKPVLRRKGWRRSTAAITELAFLAHEGHEARDIIDCISRAADHRHSSNFFLLCGHRHHRSAGRAGRVIVLEGDSLADHNSSSWNLYANGDDVAVYHQSI